MKIDYLEVEEASPKQPQNESDEEEGCVNEA
jgi:hypothetical protein